MGGFNCSCPPDFFGPLCQCTADNITDPICSLPSTNGTNVTETYPPSWYPTPTITISSLTPVDQTEGYEPSSTFPEISMSTDVELEPSPSTTIIVITSSLDLEFSTSEVLPSESPSEDWISTIFSTPVPSESSLDDALSPTPTPTLIIPTDEWTWSPGPSDGSEFFTSSLLPTSDLVTTPIPSISDDIISDDMISSSLFTSVDFEIVSYTPTPSGEVEPSLTITPPPFSSNSTTEETPTEPTEETSTEEPSNTTAKTTDESNYATTEFSEPSAITESTLSTESMNETTAGTGEESYTSTEQSISETTGRISSATREGRADGTDESVSTTSFTPSEGTDDRNFTDSDISTTVEITEAQDTTSAFTEGETVSKEATTEPFSTIFTPTAETTTERSEDNITTETGFQSTMTGFTNGETVSAEATVETPSTAFTPIEETTTERTEFSTATDITRSKNTSTGFTDGETVSTQATFDTSATTYTSIEETTTERADLSTTTITTESQGTTIGFTDEVTVSTEPTVETPSTFTPTAETTTEESRYSKITGITQSQGAGTGFTDKETVSAQTTLETSATTFTSIEETTTEPMRYSTTTEITESQGTTKGFTDVGTASSLVTTESPVTSSGIPEIPVTDGLNFSTTTDASSKEGISSSVDSNETSKLPFSSTTPMSSGTDTIVTFSTTEESIGKWTTSTTTTPNLLPEITSTEYGTETQTSFYESTTFPTNESDPCLNYCQNFGTCVLVNEFEPVCICRFKFSGRQCEVENPKVNVPAFRGNSFLQYKLPSESRSLVDVSLRMATVVPDGIVMYTSPPVEENSYNNSYALIFIENGHLVLHFSCGSQSMEFVETRTKVNNGFNFTLNLSIDVGIQQFANRTETYCLGKLSLNDSAFVMSGEQRLGQRSFPVFENLYLGGVETRMANGNGMLDASSEAITFLPGFRGCLFEISVSF